jgi:hypothetical protein
MSLHDDTLVTVGDTARRLPITLDAIASLPTAA